MNELTFKNVIDRTISPNGSYLTVNERLRSMILTNDCGLSKAKARIFNKAVMSDFFDLWNGYKYLPTGWKQRMVGTLVTTQELPVLLKASKKENRFTQAQVNAGMIYLKKLKRELEDQEYSDQINGQATLF